MVLFVYRLYNKTSAMYESGATRWFKYGRTDTIRSTSNASLKFLKAMSNPSATVCGYVVYVVYRVAVSCTALLSV